MSAPDDTQDVEDKSLIAYRLGRVEKAVDNINQQSIDRDKEIITKLDNLTTLTQQVASNSFRIASLENSRSNMYKFISALGVTLGAVILQIVLSLI